jgi:hypothetical protein
MTTNGAYVPVAAATRLFVGVIVLSVLTACSGSGHRSHKFAIGGNVTGLTGNVVLQNNGADNLTIGANGSFTFPTKVKKGKAYSVTVLTQPAGAACTVTNGSGTARANVTNVTVTCASRPTVSIGGSVGGLTGTVVLQNNGGDDLSISANGPFTFASKVASGGAYAVTVRTQPAAQTCTVQNGSGTASANVTNIVVSCVATVATFTVGGTISGLTGGGLKLADGATNAVSPAPNATTFTLPNALPAGTEYSVGIAAQPAGQTCLITNSKGVIAANVNNVSVTCSDNVTDPIVGSYEAQIPGSLVYVTLFADGVYIYGSIENDAACGQNDGNGIEYGIYTYSAASGAFSIKSALVDTNGKCGLWDNGPGPLASGTLQKTGSGQATVLTLTVGGGAQVVLRPVPSSPGLRYGAFGDAAEKGFTLFLANIFYFIAETQADSGNGRLAGVEYGCAYGNAAASGTLSIDLTATCQIPAPVQNRPVDTNGNAGFSAAGGSVPYAMLDADTLRLGGPPGDTLTRIIPN